MLIEIEKWVYENYYYKRKILLNHLSNGVEELEKIFLNKWIL